VFIRVVDAPKKIIHSRVVWGAHAHAPSVGRPGGGREVNMLKSSIPREHVCAHLTLHFCIMFAIRQTLCAGRLAAAAMCTRAAHARFIHTFLMCEACAWPCLLCTHTIGLLAMLFTRTHCVQSPSIGTHVSDNYMKHAHTRTHVCRHVVWITVDTWLCCVEVQSGSLEISGRS
jgi:hypothetical protein